MTEEDRNKNREDIVTAVDEQAKRKQKARSERRYGIWFGFGMFGLIGWAVAVPTLLGIALGMWLDSRWPTNFSWTLALLFAGIILGCFNAWRWIVQENEKRNEGNSERTRQ